MTHTANKPSPRIGGLKIEYMYIINIEIPEEKQLYKIRGNKKSQ